MFCKVNEGELCKWSINRPGVATTMSGWRRNEASWDFKSNPPVDRHMLMLLANCASWRKTWWICTHNSRVGARTRTRVHGAVWCGLYNKRSRIGNEKAMVLPEPVTAHAQTSRPSNANGTVAAWIGVGEWRPIADNAWMKGTSSRIRENGKRLLWVKVEKFSYRKKLDPDWRAVTLRRTRPATNDRRNKVRTREAEKPFCSSTISSSSPLSLSSDPFSSLEPVPFRTIRLPNCPSSPVSPPLRFCFSEIRSSLSFSHRCSSSYLLLSTSNSSDFLVDRRQLTPSFQRFVVDFGFLSVDQTAFFGFVLKSKSKIDFSKKTVGLPDRIEIGRWNPTICLWSLGLIDEREFSVPVSSDSVVAPLPPPRPRHHRVRPNQEYSRHRDLELRREDPPWNLEENAESIRSSRGRERKRKNYNTDL